MQKRKVFYSFHFDADVLRVQQVRQIGALEGNTSVSPNEWEELRKNRAVDKWIDREMAKADCVVVLIGTQTHGRPWVQYEINQAMARKRPLLGVHIHNLRCMNTGTCAKGADPLARHRGLLYSYPTTYDPRADDAYNDIARNLPGWIEHAIQARR